MYLDVTYVVVSRTTETVGLLTTSSVCVGENGGVWRHMNLRMLSKRTDASSSPAMSASILPGLIFQIWSKYNSKFQQTTRNNNSKFFKRTRNNNWKFLQTIPRNNWKCRGTDRIANYFKELLFRIIFCSNYYFELFFGISNYYLELS